MHRVNTCIKDLYSARAKEMGKGDKSKALDLTSAARGVWLIKVNVFVIAKT